MHETSIFPCGIFQYKKGVNDKPGTPNYDLKILALKSTAKRLYPNWANCDWSAQTKWVKYDRDTKINIINNLEENDYWDFGKRLIENPELQKTLGINVEFDKTYKFTPNYEQLPFEIFSTINKLVA